MELNEPFEGHEHATTSLKVILLVFALVVISALAYLMQVTYSQPDTTQETAPTVTGKASSASEVAGWKTYTDASGKFSFQYPPTLKINSDVKGETTLMVSFSNLSTMEDLPSGYDRETLTGLRDDLKSGKVKTAISGSLVKETVTLRQLDICDLQFSYVFDIFDGADSVVTLTYSLAGSDKTSVIANNPSYFTTDTANCGSEKVWQTEGETAFRADLAAGKTDSATKQWTNDAKLIATTFKWID